MSVEVLAKCYVVVCVVFLRVHGQYFDNGFKNYHYEWKEERAAQHDSAYKFLCLVMGLCTLPLGAYPQHSSKFKTVYEWGQLEFDYGSSAERKRDVEDGNFIPGAIIPIDVDVYYPSSGQPKTFITIPRFQAGVPVTLGTVQASKPSQVPLVKPYPSWSWHRNSELCKKDRLVSVFRVKVDRCGRLWVLDTGKVLSKQVCPAQILAFDLKTNQLIHRYEIPHDQMEQRSILVTPVVDIRETCRDVFVYVGDCQTYSIIVYDVVRGKSWLVTDKTMYPYPSYGTYKIQGDQFDLMDGILGMDISPYVPGKDRKLYYHAMSSATENWVYTSHLRNFTRFEHDPTSSPEIFHTYVGTRPSQSAAEAIDRNGISYFGLMTETTINCWNTAKEYGGSNIDTVEYNPKTLQFASGVKVLANERKEEELWILTCRLQKMMTGTLNPSETNFRIQTARVSDVLKGTKCGHGQFHFLSGSSNRYGGGQGTGGYGLASLSNKNGQIHFPGEKML